VLRGDNMNASPSQMSRSRNRDGVALLFHYRVSIIYGESTLKKQALQVENIAHHVAHEPTRRISHAMFGLELTEPHRRP
jgi:hypothetical protein